MTDDARLRRYHAPVWDEPVIMEMSHPGRRGQVFNAPEKAVRQAVGEPARLLPEGLARRAPPALPEMSEHDVLRHFLHLSQETLGMMGISLFGTCTMKYNSALGEALAWRPEIAQLHPFQDADTLQGVLAIIHGLDRQLCALSGMDQFVFQAGGGAHAAYTNCCVTRAYHASKGELAQRNQIITSIQSHPCNPATAAAAGFEVITLMLEENGYPSLDALKAAVSERTAALMIGNPDDMGVYNPEIKEWIRVVHEAGGLCFYDHANFNGVMGKLQAAELGFDACMFMLHKTFGAPKGGNGPAVGAYGCTEKLARFLPKPVVVEEGGRYRLDDDRPESIGKVREFWGNVPQLLKAYAWTCAMGGDGIAEAADLSVLANNYMDEQLSRIKGLTRSHPHLGGYRMEMTRWSLEKLKEDTGIGTLEMQARMVDFGVDAYWLSHEPWLVAEPFTPEAGELWSKEDLDYWVAVIEHIAGEAYANPEIVRTAPHHQPIHQIKGEKLEDPNYWAMTWRAYLKKKAAHGQAA